MSRSSVHQRTRIVLFALVLSCAMVAHASDTEPSLAEGWYARVDTTLGDIVIELLPEQAPQAVAHVAALAEGELEWFDVVTGEPKKTRYYDGIAVHLAEAGQRFEVGDPTGTGRGAPRIFVPLEFGAVSFSEPGRVGLTRDGLGRISGAQFFVTVSGLPWLNTKHTCFGKVVEGLEVVRRITSVKTYSNGRPMEPPLVERVDIFAVGDPAPLPKPEIQATRRGPLKRRKKSGSAGQ